MVYGVADAAADAARSKVNLRGRLPPPKDIKATETVVLEDPSGTVAGLGLSFWAKRVPRARKGDL